jgi:hypothetical protein
MFSDESQPQNLSKTEHDLNRLFQKTQREFLKNIKRSNSPDKTFRRTRNNDANSSFMSVTK